MIVEVSRGFILVDLDGRQVKVPGEMFFPPNDKMGFAIFKNDIDSWERPNEKLKLTDEEVESVIAEIKKDFDKGGHTLEIE